MRTTGWSFGLVVFWLIFSLPAQADLAFEENRGQTDGQVRFLARAPGYTLFLTSSEVVLVPRDGAPPTRLRWRGANPAPSVSGEGELPGRSHYLVGKDPAKWRTGISSYARVRYRSVYPGIDLVFHGNPRQLEYRLEVSPGADPLAVRLSVEGADGKAAAGGGPVLAYSTYLGGSSVDRGHAMAVDAAGNAYVTGETQSVDFPATGSGPRGVDAYVTKIAPDGSLVYSLFLGGSAADSGQGIAVDAQGRAIVAGFTGSSDFPRVSPLPASFQGEEEDAFVAKIAPSGASLLYSTRLGGANRDEARGVAVDAAGNAYLAGATLSADFPTVNAFQTTLFASDFLEPDAFVAKLSPGGSQLVYSTYLGGGGRDQIEGIAVDAGGHAVVAGYTHSYEFEIPPAGAVQASRPRSRIVLASHSYSEPDAFVAKLRPAGSSLVYFQRITGGGSDYATDVAVDAAGNAWVSGQTDSQDFPVRDAFQPALNGPTDAVVLKLSSGGEVLWATYLGGRDEETSLGIAVDAAGDAWVAGATDSTDFPLRNPVQAECAPAVGSLGRCVTDAFITELRPDGSGLLFSTFLGGSVGAPGGYDPIDAAVGIAVDPRGSAYVTGVTTSVDFPTVDAFQPSYGGGAQDAFVVRLSQNRPPLCTSASASPSVLWPPNGKLRPIAIRGVTDPDGDRVSITITSIRQDEPLSRRGSPDGSGVGTSTAQVRGDRKGSGDGRVYHLGFTASDGQGGSCTGEVTVCVPHDQARRTCGDGGALYDSTGR
ncbi:MAG TPA: SBBP repeat-containing protein [Thermoanaerobaculia bacterium]